jgi:hypothetical protein
VHAHSLSLQLPGVVVGETLSTYRGRIGIGGVYLHSHGAYTSALYVMVDIVKGDGRAPPTLTSRANFSIMMECMPKSGHCHSVYSVGEILFIKIECTKPFVFQSLFTFGSTNAKLAEHIMISIA